MPKNRTKPPVGAPKSAEEFAAGAQTKTVTKSSTNPFDPNESRTQLVNGKVKPFKTIGLQFNRYEWWELEQAVKKSKRTTNSIIREGILKELNSIKQS